MIYSDRFVWLHFPKCAGNTVETIFRDYLSGAEGITQDTIGIEGNPEAIWHDSIAQREERDPGFSLGDRVVICSFRRLLPWLESRYSFEAVRSPDLPHRPESLLEGHFLESNGFENNADYYASWYLPESILDSGRLRLLRTEYFEADFKALFGQFVDLSPVPDWVYRARTNASTRILSQGERDALHASRESVYRHCPYWAGVERAAYPDA